MSIAALIEALARPGALVPGEAAEVIQTHISVVFLAGERAYKIKKPIRLWGFLDYGTVAARQHWCEEEVRLNRRLAPDIYLGVARVTRTAGGAEIDGPGEVIDHAVVMRRLPAGVTLLERLEAGTLDAAVLAATGRKLAAFQACHRLEPTAARGARPGNFGHTLRANFGTSRGGVPEVFPARVHDGVRKRILRRLWRERARIRARVAAGRPVDGHGDIRLEHVVLLDEEIGVIDCCEFSTTLRHIDPLSDAAFLSMDLTVRGHPELAAAYERAYLDAASDPDGPHLLPLYRAYRAHVRAMVDLQSARAPEIPAATRAHKALGAQRTMAVAWSQSRVGAPPPVIVLRGASGVGKSWVATRLAPWLRAEIIRSDVVRKELLGVAPTWRPSAEEKRVVYGAAMHARTYQAVLDRADAALARGRAVFLDATYLRRDTRDEVQAFARERGAPYAVLDVTCDEYEVRRRLLARASRNDDASDADQAIHDEMMRTAEPLAADELRLVAHHRSGESPEACILALCDVLEAQVDADHEPLGPEQP
ncbi:MAG: AAA family ATPase [Planctomycetota bacterium]|nr:AAA family ATPase [Planctomycetota bacterium]